MIFKCRPYIIGTCHSKSANLKKKDKFDHFMNFYVPARRASLCYISKTDHGMNMKFGKCTQNFV